MSVQARERETYESMWGVEDYSASSPGANYVEAFLVMAGITDPSQATVLDAGCGSGKGALALSALGFRVRMCDLTDAGIVPEARGLIFTETALWHDLRASLGYVSGGLADYVYCCDVLEHIPTHFTMLSIARMLEVCRHGLFLSIALVPDRFGVFVGYPLHQTVQSFVWWRDACAELGTVIECRDLGTTGLYLVAPR
jgi:2-polyprenyl-3-methyl-5-hydroxy-6-metoxy-1,4-benzoquinol methylase